MLAKHCPWNESAFPSFEHGAVDATVVCGVKGDGETDDHASLQACVRTYPAVFLPKGHYRLSQTLELPPGVQLVGLGTALSVLMPTSKAFGGSGQTRPQPLVRTLEGHPGVTLAFIGVMSWFHLPVFTLEWGSTGGLWRSNYETRVMECMWLTDYNSTTTDPPCRPSINLTVPKTLIHGTGAFVNYVSDVDMLFTSHRDYRHVLVDMSQVEMSEDDGLTFYQINLEHSMSEANMELRGARDTNIFGLKVEGSTSILWMRDCSNISFWGLGGGSDAFPSVEYYPDDFDPYPPTIFRIERSAPIRLFNLADTGRGYEGKPIRPLSPCSAAQCDSNRITPKIVAEYPWPPYEIPKVIRSMWAPWPGYAVPPSQWRLLGEFDGAHTQIVTTPPLDKPVAYTRDVLPFRTPGSNCGAPVPKCLRGNDTIYVFGPEDMESKSVRACCEAASAWLPEARAWQLVSRDNRSEECRVSAHFVTVEQPLHLRCISAPLTVASDAFFNN